MKKTAGPTSAFTPDATVERSYDFAPITGQIKRWVEKGYHSRASLLIAKDGCVVCEEYFGAAKPETVEYVASAGKWLAAATIVTLVDDGNLSLDDPAAKWLPEFTGVKGRATVRQMLAHTSGYPRKGARPDDCQTLGESVANIAPLEPVAEPGARWEYGGLAMQVAGRIAEVAGGQDWETLFQERIARPARMKNTRFTPVDPAPGHNPMLGGGARSTLRDYANFLAMLCNGGMFNGRQVLSEKAIAEMQADQVRGASVLPGPFDKFISTWSGSRHNGVYGLGEWREIEDTQGHAVLVSSPSWAGAYPWIDKRHSIYGVFLSHVNRDAAGKDKFNAMLSSAALTELAAKVIEAAARG